MDHRFNLSIADVEKGHLASRVVAYVLHSFGICTTTMVALYTTMLKMLFRFQHMAAMLPAVALRFTVNCNAGHHHLNEQRIFPNIPHQ